MKGVNVAVGCFFIAIATFLYASKHITAAIMTAYMNNPNVNYFGGGYDSIGFGITFWIAVSLIAGVGFLLSGAWPAFSKTIKRTSD